MSLDVYLELETAVKKSGPQTGIFIRENGAMKEITRAEWDRRNPDRDPVVSTPGHEAETHEVYWRNITHNLGKMADKAGVYDALWRPDEHGMERAEQLIEPLRDGLMRLRDDPDGFKKWNPENGWGDYEGLVAFVADYLHACEKFPQAFVRVSR